MTTTQDQAADQRLTIEETVESLTGFEELAIKAHFDSTVDSFESGTMLLRALVFVLGTRAGLKTAVAKEQAMGLKIKQLPAQFADDPDEITPDEPVTAAGKDDEQPG